MYYYAAMRATSLDSLKGLRVLDVSHGQTDYLKFLAKFFSPKAVVGYDSIRKQFTTSGYSNNPDNATNNTINLAQLLSREKRFDLILCIETWNKLGDKDRFLHQVRELLSQSPNEQDQAPNVECEQFNGRQRVVIADIFRMDEEPVVKALLSTYFEIDDVIDISMNVQKSVIKQKDRKNKFLAKSTHYQIVKEAISQANRQLSSSPLA